MQTNSIIKSQRCSAQTWSNCLLACLRIVLFVCVSVCVEESTLALPSGRTESKVFYEP